MSDAKPTHTVVHPKQYLSVGGKLQHVRKGTQVVLTAAVAKRLGKKVLAIGAGETVEIDKKAETKAK